MAGRGRQNADERLAVELAAGKTIRGAASSAGVAERTAHRRLVDAAFRARVAELRGQSVDAAAGRIADAMAHAADVLRGLLDAPEGGTRLRAAVKVLELGIRIREAVELEMRVRELEARLQPGEPE